jgi:Tfp pilus assembly protein PilE
MKILFSKKFSFKYMGWIKIITLLVAVTIHTAAFTQQVTVNGGFLSDSIKIGEQTAFYLATHYPRNVVVLFPDSTHKFTHFEYERKIYFSTQTTDSISVDSAVYFLTTFEIDRIQYLNLPVYIINKKDCTVYRSATDSLLITQLVQQVPDSINIDKLPLKMNTAYQKVFFQFNYMVGLIIIAVLIILGIAAWLIFGKRIVRYFKVKKLLQKHAEFIESYTNTIGTLKSTFSTATTESALSQWKKYMEHLEAWPYTKLTTREILRLENDKTLGEKLSAIDMAIYGHNTAVVDPLEELKTIADQRFTKKLEEVNHGK